MLLYLPTGSRYNVVKGLIYMEFFKNNEVSIGYIQSGKGKSLFFIHGLGADHLMFEPQIEYFSDRYHVVFPDLRGNGQSSQ